MKTHIMRERRLSALVLNFLSLGEEEEWEMTLYFSLLSKKRNSTWLGTGNERGLEEPASSTRYLQSDAEPGQDPDRASDHTCSQPWPVRSTAEPTYLPTLTTL